MRSVVSAKVKIPATPEIVKTISIYRKALKFCVDYAWEHNITQNFKLHYAIYHDIRKQFGLPSQLTVGCIRQACSMIKTSITSFNNLSKKRKAKLGQPTKPKIDKVAVSYNFPRTADLHNNVLIIRTMNTRLSFEINIPDCYTEYFTWGKPDESLLMQDRKQRCFFVFTFSKEVAVTEQNNASQQVLGIDLGVNNLAVCSDGRFYNSAKVKQVKRKFRYLRSKLQSIGTRSARRKLKKLAGRETRYMRHVNHVMSKDIVSNFSGNKIVMENLKGIRKTNRGKRMNYWISNWSFYQLQTFIEYKAAMKGVEVVKVKPNYTSQICHRCGQLGSRSKGCFECHTCNLHRYNADRNAALNLAHPMLVERQAAITPPIDCDVEAKGVSQYANEAESTVKYPAL